MVDTLPLSGREVEVLQLVAARLRNQEIAAQLGLSVHTVARYLAATNRKLGVHSREEAVARATEHGILKSAPPGQQTDESRR